MKARRIIVGNKEKKYHVAKVIFLRRWQRCPFFFPYLPETSSHFWRMSWVLMFILSNCACKSDIHIFFSNSLCEKSQNTSYTLSRWIWPTRLGAASDVPSKFICFWCLKIPSTYFWCLALLTQKKSQKDAPNAKASYMAISIPTLRIVIPFI